MPLELGRGSPCGRRGAVKVDYLTALLQWQFRQPGVREGQASHHSGPSPEIDDLACQDDVGAVGESSASQELEVCPSAAHDQCQRLSKVVRRVSKSGKSTHASYSLPPRERWHKARLPLLRMSSTPGQAPKMRTSTICRPWRTWSTWTPWNQRSSMPKVSEPGPSPGSGLHALAEPPDRGVLRRPRARGLPSVVGEGRGPAPVLAAPRYVLRVSSNFHLTVTRVRLSSSKRPWR